MTYLLDEMRAIEKEKRLGDRVKNKDKEFFVFVKLMLILTVLSVSMYANSVYGVCCPACDTEFEVTAKEVPYVGCYCDNCGTYYSHGSKCPRCGYGRYR